MLQAMLADVLAACGERKDATIDAAELAERFKLTDEELEDHLQLLNLVNFGGGCYAVYAERVDEGRTIHVEKELYGDEFRRPARLSPLEAKALLLALDLVGPLVAADAGTTLDDVRAKLEAAFGRYDMRGAPDAPADAARRGRALGALLGSAPAARVVEIEYLGRQADAVDAARRRAALPARRARRLVLRHLGSHAPTASARSASTASARRTRWSETFERRASLTARVDGALGDHAGTALVSGSRPTSRAGSSRAGPTPSRLADGAALASVPYGSERWLCAELCRYLRRGRPARARAAAGPRRASARASSPRSCARTPPTSAP